MPPAKSDAQIALADFYHRRVRPLDEIKALSVVASCACRFFGDPDRCRPSSARGRRLSASSPSFTIKPCPHDFSVAQYRAWLARYPQEQSLYARFLDFLVAQKDYAAAQQLVTDYHKQFPDGRDLSR